MTERKKRLHHQVIDKAKDWDEKMKKYRFYKEVVKDMLLMLPLAGSVLSGIIKWSVGMFRDYNNKVMEAAAPIGRRDRARI